MINFTANNIIKLFIDAIGQDALKDFYDYNMELIVFQKRTFVE